MKTLYLDMFSGVSGDMFIGALLDLGVSFQALEEALATLGLQGYHLHTRRGEKACIAGTKFDVHLTSEDDHASPTPPPTPTARPKVFDPFPGHAHPHAHHHSHPHDLLRAPLQTHTHPAIAPHEHSHDEGEQRDFRQIRSLIDASPLSPWVKEKSIAVFRRVAQAEGKIHGLPAEEVHFHEVGAADSIVDIVGACIALELLGKPRVLASNVVEGSGWIQCAHGRFPIPAPATLEILGARGISLTQCEEPHELVTPTGAALLAEFAEAFGPMENLRADRVGYGLGTRDNISRPNVLRAVIGETPDTAEAALHDWETDTVAVLETNLDDINPEILGHCVEQMLAAGALDVFHTPIQMKKNRPAVLLTVLCGTGDADRFTEVLLRETSAFGVRRTFAERRKLRREFKSVQTPFGEIAVKLGLLDGREVQAAPEFEACRQASAREGVPLKEVYQAAIQALSKPTP